MEKLCNQVEGKLYSLLSFLTKLPGKLEMVADEIDNENLRNALSAVAEESKQYAKELYAELKCLEIIPPELQLVGPEEDIIEGSVLYASRERGTEILAICENCDAYFSKLYTELISDYFFNTSLKDMMNYQLLGIKSAFMRIRFLNSLRFIHS